MVRKFLLIVLVLFSVQVFAQTGIGTTTPNASAKLDVFSTNKGFLPPRVTLTSVSDGTTIASPAEGLLVYNLGSVGLQAGYYYWNGANWATIATATSAGNGVTATDMVKIYDGVGNAATINTNGATFSVTTSGKYAFDFSTSATCGNCNVTINFQVRDGSNSNAVIGSDSQTSYNNNVHAEYNGKVEVNLTAGRSYNVLVTTSSGGIYNNDYSRVYMKQVSGNLPVTGQSVDYGIARYTGTDTGAMAAGALIAFDATAAGNLAWSGNKFTLKANKTFELESSLAIYQSAGGVAGRFQIYDYTNSVALASGLFISINGAGTNNPSGNSPMKAIVTPATDIQVGIRLLDFYGPGGPGIIGSTSILGGYAAPNSSYFLAQQIGSSAFVNPWILAGNDVYNTTGEVGIGTSTPAATAALDVSSTTKGVLIPRMTAAQKSAISSPSNGLLIFQTDAPAGFYFYNGSAWISISNPGTTTRFLPHSNNFAHFAGLQSLSSLASGSYVALNNSDLVIDVPSGYSSNKVVIKWDTWGDVATSGAANGSLRYLIKQTGTSSNTYNSVAMNGWATSGTSGTRFATPVTFILTDLAPGTYTFKLEISREGELGTVSSLNNYHVSGSVQVFVK
jgi:hypothetical protein